MPVILLVGNKKDKAQEREVEKFDAERVNFTPVYDICSIIILVIKEYFYCW